MYDSVSREDEDDDAVLNMPWATPRRGFVRGFVGDKLVAYVLPSGDRKVREAKPNAEPKDEKKTK